MSTNTENFEDLVKKEYEHGFVTDIDADTIPPGLSEEIIAFISKKKEEPIWLLEWRLKAYLVKKLLPSFLRKKKNPYGCLNGD